MFADSQGVKYETVPYTRGTVLHVYCGERKAFPHFIGVDTPADGIRPDVRVESPGDLSMVIEDASADAVYCAGHTAQASELRDWWRCLKVGGYLVLHQTQEAGESFGTIGLMRDIGSGWDLVEREPYPDASFLLVFQKRDDGAQKSSYLEPKYRGKTACVVRYGGFGDMIQAANVFPALKRQGYRVIVMTTPKGQDIIRHDPNVDGWYIQDHDQVPNHELNEFWAVVSKQFDRFINLCESVEGTILAMPGRANHGWSHEMRNKYLNHNYLEFTSELAGVPYRSESRFYPTADEAQAARDRLSTTGLNIVFALAGSSCHKFYPGQDAVIANLLLAFPDCRIFLVGDEPCKVLEVGWEKEERVVCLSGEMGIRETLALAKVVDIVVGCETGVLNAVAFEDNRKVVLLSHSSHENLTKHWNNTFSLAPQGLDCYPCHRLHYGSQFCRLDADTGAALCQRLINPEDVFAAMIHGHEVEA